MIPVAIHIIIWQLGRRVKIKHNTGYKSWVRGDSLWHCDRHWVQHWPVPNRLVPTKIQTHNTVTRRGASQRLSLRRDVVYVYTTRKLTRRYRTGRRETFCIDILVEWPEIVGITSQPGLHPLVPWFHILAEHHRSMSCEPKVEPIRLRADSITAEITCYVHFRSHVAYISHEVM